ncbi:MAG: MarR family transcriptional regulator [Caryophanon sp.]|nr:MarR family transcriptional regulator [Caryophanon sp.]
MISAKLDEQLCFEVYRAASHFNKLYTHVLAPFQLTYSQYLVLLALWEQDDVMTKDIGERLNLGIGTLNPILSKLLKRGWIEKTVSPVDKRATIISLTDYAKDQQPNIEKAILAQLEECGYLMEEGRALRQQLHELNEFFEHFSLK